MREALDAGISSSHIIIDPGPGFGKTSHHDLQVLAGIGRLTDLGYPVLLAVSRKKFIGEVLGLPEGERLEGSLAAAAWGVLHGVKIVRTHDVRATRRVVDMTEAVLHPDTVEPQT
jgi:dihydropteroate synthase